MKTGLSDEDRGLMMRLLNVGTVCDGRVNLGLNLEGLTSRDPPRLNIGGKWCQKI